MATIRFCGSCGSRDIRRVKTSKVPPPGEPLEDPYSNLILPHYHRDGPITEFLAAIESQDFASRKRGLAIEVYIRAFPEPLMDWDVSDIICEWLDNEDISRRSDIAARCFELRELGWTNWTGETAINPRTGKRNQLATLTVRGLAQLGISDPEDRAAPDAPTSADVDAIIARHLGRRRVVRRPTNWSTSMNRHTFEPSEDDRDRCAECGNSRSNHPRDWR